jgi:hypothetical protein
MHIPKLEGENDFSGASVAYGRELDLQSQDAISIELLAMEPSVLNNDA